MSVFLYYRDPLDRRKGEETHHEDLRQDDLYAREGRDPSVERRYRGNERGRDGYHDRRHRASPTAKEGYDDERGRHREEGRRRDSRDPRDRYVEPAVGFDPAVDRHPERLMRGHGEPPAKDLDYIDKYTGKPVHRHRDFTDDLTMNHGNRQHLDPSSAVAKTARSRRKLESMLRNDSLSSDPSDCVRPPPPKPHKHRKGKKQRQASLSSSDDEIQTTPECTSCDEQEIESESVSEKGRTLAGPYEYYIPTITNYIMQCRYRQ